MSDKLTNCPCGKSDACWVTEQEGITSHLCMGCGFSTASDITSGSKQQAVLFETMPELYKDIAWVDSDNKVWVPATITVPDVGIVFIDGSTRDDWKWVGVLNSPIPQEDRWRFPGVKTKTDMSTRKVFDQRGFIDALDYIGFFNEEV